MSESKDKVQISRLIREIKEDHFDICDAEMALRTRIGRMMQKVSNLIKTADEIASKSTKSIKKDEQ